jgi:hypothetical protein
MLAFNLCPSGLGHSNAWTANSAESSFRHLDEPKSFGLSYLVIDPSVDTFNNAISRKEVIQILFLDVLREVRHE